MMTAEGMRSPESLGIMAARLPTEEQARFKEAVFKSEEEQVRGPRNNPRRPTREIADVENMVKKFGLCNVSVNSRDFWR